MKNLISKNIGLKLLSVLLALLLWLIVMNVEDPAVTRTIYDIPVQIVNDDVIKSRGYGYTVESGEKIDIRVKGRRSVVDGITADDFIATADFNSVSSMKMVPIEVRCKDEHESELSWTARTETMAIILEAEGTVSKSIRLEKIGDVKEGYFLYDCSTETSLVSVKGAESQVATVKEVVADVKIDGIKDSGEVEIELYAVDTNNAKMDSKKITIVPDTIKVNLTVCPVKTVPLNVRAVGTPAEYCYLGDVEFAPAQVQITAEESILASLNEIVVDVSVYGASETINKQINLEEFFESTYKVKGIKLVDQNSTMGIKVPVLNMEEKSFDLKAEDIELRGKDEHHSYTMYFNWMSKVVVRGKIGEMTNVEASDFGLYVDVEGLEKGNHSIQVMSDYDGEYALEIGKINVLVDDLVNETYQGNIYPDE